MLMKRILFIVTMILSSIVTGCRNEWMKFEHIDFKITGTGIEYYSPNGGGTLRMTAAREGCDFTMEAYGKYKSIPIVAFSAYDGEEHHYVKPIYHIEEEDLPLILVDSNGMRVELVCFDPIIFKMTFEQNESKRERRLHIDIGGTYLDTVISLTQQRSE